MGPVIERNRRFLAFLILGALAVALIGSVLMFFFHDFLNRFPTDNF